MKRINIRSINIENNVIIAKLLSPTIKTLESTCEIIGTGISCGVDSLYTIKKHTS